MTQSEGTRTTVEIIGSGVSGLCCAQQFVERDCQVVLRASSTGVDEDCCSWWAGGMLAPWCEMESAEPLIGKLGKESMMFWQEQFKGYSNRGSLVVASQRDLPDLEQFANRTSAHRRIDAAELAELEPDLQGRFDRALYYEQEAHLDPRSALLELQAKLMSDDRVTFEFNQTLSNDELTSPSQYDWRIDCRGLAASDQLTDLRGVKGEMLILQCPQMTLARPLRLLHPRYPLYIVPRENHTFMVGASMIESEDRTHITARSLMELLSAAYAVHPAFAEAAVLETGTDARPAFPDNLPRIRRRGRTVFVNGLFRHGFLCAPALAKRAAALVVDNTVDKELVDEYSP